MEGMAEDIGILTAITTAEKKERSRLLTEIAVLKGEIKGHKEQIRALKTRRPRSQHPRQRPSRQTLLVPQPRPMF